MAYGSFQPPARILMGSGPSDVSPRVLEALGRPTIGHLDPAFTDMMEALKALLRQAFLTRNVLTMPVSAPGSAGMEACFCNLVEADDTVIVCRNGVFGERQRENVIRAGGRAVMVDSPWGRAVELEKLEDALRANPQARIVAFVHAETSTGAQSDAEAIAALARRYDCLTIADTVTSLGGSPLHVDAWGLDAVYSGSQKCLSCVPGLSPVTFSDAAVDKVKARKTKVRSWFLDINLVINYWAAKSGKRSYHHTAPINSLYALYESLVMLVEEEGLERAWQRHRTLSARLRDDLQALGLSYLVPPDERLPQINTVRIPDGVNDAAVRAALLNDYGLEISAGLGELAGKVWRIGLMGASCSKRHVALCVSALREVLSRHDTLPGLHG